MLYVAMVASRSILHQKVISFFVYISPVLLCISGLWLCAYDISPTYCVFVWFLPAEIQQNYQGDWLIDFWCLTPLLAIFQLYHQGFQVRGAHLKKLRRAEGGAKILGVFHVKNHDFTLKNHIFSNCGGRREKCWGISCENLIFSNFRGVMDHSN